MLSARLPVIAVSAVRTGCGKDGIEIVEIAAGAEDDDAPTPPGFRSRRSHPKSLPVSAAGVPLGMDGRRDH
ncbi:MAG TPA: hypothetical protein VGR91_19875 [Stellaceae bacterium]|nr:hypothetical protein [Stellaceae bacterium]